MKQALLNRFPLLGRIPWRNPTFRRALWSLVVGGWIASLVGAVGSNRCRADWVITFGKEALPGACDIDWIQVIVASFFTGLAVLAIWSSFSGMRGDRDSKG